MAATIYVAAAAVVAAAVRGCEAFLSHGQILGHVDTWTRDTWTLGHLDTCTLGHLDTWTLGRFDAWALGHLDIKTLRHLDTWTLEHLDTRENIRDPPEIIKNQCS